MRLIFSSLLALTLLSTWSICYLASERIIIVTHSDNTDVRLSREQIRDLFMGLRSVVIAACGYLPAVVRAMQHQDRRLSDSGFSVLGSNGVYWSPPAASDSQFRGAWFSIFLIHQAALAISLRTQTWEDLVTIYATD